MTTTVFLTRLFCRTQAVVALMVLVLLVGSLPSLYLPAFLLFSALLSPFCDASAVFACGALAATLSLLTLVITTITVTTTTTTTTLLEDRPTGALVLAVEVLGKSTNPSFFCRCHR